MILGFAAFDEEQDSVMMAITPIEAAVDRAEMVSWINGFMENHRHLCSTTSEM